MMKRTRRWLLMLSAVVGLMAHAGALRPSSLNFGKSARTSTTASTTQSSTTPTTSTTTEAAVEEAPAARTSNTSETSKLTGIPQIDYVWDPNLPRELNGFNLSEYPFHGTIPVKEIDFKCDGLHDGFYASIKHKCQIYHHCIYGIRHDFLCANYTAFDQRTFICHFASEVDCKNSGKYFFRNDALYKATTTTSTTTTTTSTVAPPLRPGGKRPRRPYRRRRPVDYYYEEEYDDYYEDRPNRRQKNRPRPRRPDYEDDFEDDIYEKRPAKPEKRPLSRERNRGGSADEYSGYDRRQNERPSEKTGKRPIGRPVEEEPIERTADRPVDRPRNQQSDSRRYEEDDDRVSLPRKVGKRRRPIDALEDADEEVVGGSKLGNRRRPIDGFDGDEKEVVVSSKLGKRRRPVDDFEDEESEDVGSRRSVNDRRPQYPKTEDAKKFVDEEEYRRPVGGRRRKGGQRPAFDDEEDDKDRPLRRDPIDDKPSYKTRSEEKVEVAPVIRSSAPGGSLFERPRVPPRIAPPVPVNERNKFIYPTTKKTPTTEATRYDEEYYDEYEDVSPAKKAVKGNKHANGGGAFRSRDRDQSRPDDDFDRPVPVKEDPKTRYETVGSNSGYDDYDDLPIKSPKHQAPVDRDNIRPSTTSREELFRGDVKHKQESFPTVVHKPKKQFSPEPKVEVEPDLYEDPRRSPPKDDENDDNSNRDNSRQVVRVIKRPFLPSRGGSPYLPRGLQVVGAAQKPLPTESTPIDTGSTVSAARLLEHGPPLLRANSDLDDYPPQRSGPRTTQQPQLEQERAALQKLYESEFDVTLNDALNPTLKPITRGLPNGFAQSNSFANRFAPPYSYQDSLYSSTDSRRAAVASPAAPTRTSQSRHEQSYYDYDY